MFFGDKRTRAIWFLAALPGSVFATPALAHGTHHHARHVHFAQAYAHQAYAHPARVIQCVAFAKWDAGIDISGNARDWWNNAAGIYERGARPEAGSVLSFRPNARMPLGHVAVVSGIADGRTILIDQSHWNSRGVTRDIEVKDVSENNDWSAVRVQLGHGGDFGSIYPTHGFIYPRPDGAGGTTMDSTHEGTGDVHAVRHQRRTARLLEVAEAPVSGPLDLNVGGLALDAPNRALR